MSAAGTAAATVEGAEGTAHTTRRAPARKSGYLPGLDGLRALAILGVLMTHDLPWTLAGHSNVAWKGTGGWGVQLFFAISGILICWRMCEEEEKTGRFHLGGFYVRRLFRIQPASWVYLLAILLLGVAAVIPFSLRLWFSALFMYSNFTITTFGPPGPGVFFGHFWTLAVEEHFYIILSLVFFFVAPRFRAKTLAGLVVLLFLFQHYAPRYGLYVPPGSERRSYWQLQLLLLPALLAIVIRTHPDARAFVTRYGKPWVAALLTFGLMVVSQIEGWMLHESSHLIPYSALDFIVSNGLTVLYCFEFFVLAVMLHPRAWSTRLLERAPLRFIGRISYSLYLWHVLFFVPDILPGGVHAHWLTLLSARPWKYIASFAMAILSYYVIEKPLIRLGHRLAPPATAGHRDLGPDPAPPARYPSSRDHTGASVLSS